MRNNKNDYSVLLSDSVWPRVQKKLLANIKNKTMRDNMQIILANTRSVLKSSTDMQNLVYLPKVVLPLVRRLFPKLIANQIISVQPLTGPSGWIRFLDAYVTVPGGSPANIYPWGDGDSVYSTPQTDVSDNILADAGGNTDTAFSGTLSKTPSEGTLFIEVGDAATVVGSTTFTKIGEIDKRGVVHSLGSTYTIIGFVDPSELTYVINFATAPDKGLKFTYKEDIQKNIPFGADQTYSMMNFNISKIPVEAKTRKLGATYSFELMEDYKNEFGENFEDKMVDYLTTSILTEIDGEIISMLFTKAEVTGSWDATMPLTWTKGLNAWYETIMPKINKVSNYIYQHTHEIGRAHV